LQEINTSIPATGSVGSAAGTSSASCRVLDADLLTGDREGSRSRGSLQPPIKGVLVPF
jgi:hypothetical protein